MPVVDRAAVSARYGTKVWPRPGEAVGFVQDDPRAVAVQTKASLGLPGNLYSEDRILRLPMGYRKDGDNVAPITGGDGEQHGAGSVFAAFVGTARRFMAPQKGIS